jgi:hypothetical protein
MVFPILFYTGKIDGTNITMDTEISQSNLGVLRSVYGKYRNIVIVDNI